MKSSSQQVSSRHASHNNKTEGSSPLVEATRHLLQPNGSIVGRHVADVIKPRFPTFASAIPSCSQRSALGSLDGRDPINHSQVRVFVQDFGTSLHQLGFGRGDRVALVLPNGPELALAIVATANWASCVPLSATAAPEELEADLQRCGADLVIGPYSGAIVATNTTNNKSAPRNDFHVLPKAEHNWESFKRIQDSARRLGIPFCGLVPSPHESGIFRLVVPRRKPVQFDALPDLVNIRSSRQKVDTLPNSAQNEVLVLFTSGTTGQKKLVPHLLLDMLTAAATIVLSWDLTPADVNCNLMPLFHVGGIVRQVFSPLCSGGCVICCPAFDPSLFWALLEKVSSAW